MTQWFNRLKIQAALIAVFGILVLIGSLSVALNEYGVIRVNTLSEQMAKDSVAYDRLIEASTDLYELELAQVNFMMTGDAHFLSNFENYNDRVDDYLRVAMLEAETDEQRSSLLEVQDTKEEYLSNFILVVQEMEGWEASELETSWDKLNSNLESIDEQMNNAADELLVKLERILDQVSFSLIASITIGLIALIIFTALAVIVGRMVSQRLITPVEIFIQVAENYPLDGNFDLNKIREIAAQNDEMGQLGRAFIEMTEGVHRRRTRLEMQVEELRLKVAYHRQEHN